MTGGNPFYVSEILEAGWPSVPPTVRDAVRRGWPLSSSPGMAVEAAAVIGARVPPELFAALADRAGSANASRPPPRPRGPGLRFRHELVRRAVASAMPGAAHAELHARLLGELESGGDASGRTRPPRRRRGRSEGSASGTRRRPHGARPPRRAPRGSRPFRAGLAYSAPDAGGARQMLQEALAGEYALLDRWQEAEQALRAALATPAGAGRPLAAAGFSGSCRPRCGGVPRQECERAAWRRSRCRNVPRAGARLGLVSLGSAAPRGRIAEGFDYCQLGPGCPLSGWANRTS